jgi:hypothetical protein
MTSPAPSLIDLLFKVTEVNKFKISPFIGAIHILHISYKTAAPHNSIFYGYVWAVCVTKPIDFGCDPILGLAINWKQGHLVHIGQHYPRSLVPILLWHFSQNIFCLWNDNTNFYYFIVSIYLWFHLFGNYSYVSDVSDDPDGIFACWVQRRSQRPLSTKQPEFALS